MNEESLKKTIETVILGFIAVLAKNSGTKAKLLAINNPSAKSSTIAMAIHYLSKFIRQAWLAIQVLTLAFTDRRLFPDSKDLVPMAQPQDNTSITKVLNDLYATIKDRQIHPVKRLLYKLSLPRRTR